ncbi:PqqD family protein [Promicromonospora thailandica]|uniref:Coenzyme PQQ synthesis protein D (PqqD) n=1 Tax=Promicromonospora thailandica TaxID=765201 RepID=A0A9X2G2E4_9MICO|nr:PqqD family protein [Promicromonospora thailandica]MCP2264635.1 Coenzyme PQQ synthesis protein D (PqqD) [Promicromonospora thailandica]BFF20290.1 hypothetical protein GCM10025730_38110 [Promicromonospora thailandica]
MRTEPLIFLRPPRYVRATITRQGGMVLDLRGRGRWHALSPVAAVWWQCLATGMSVTATAERVAARYGVSRELAQRDGDALVRDLHGRGLLRPPRRSRKDRAL